MQDLFETEETFLVALYVCILRELLFTLAKFYNFLKLLEKCFVLLSPDVKIWTRIVQPSKKLGDCLWKCACK